jgi:hypothetical protein
LRKLFSLIDFFLKTGIVGIDGLDENNEKSLKKDFVDKLKAGKVRNC